MFEQKNQAYSFFSLFIQMNRCRLKIYLCLLFLLNGMSCCRHKQNSNRDFTPLDIHLTAIMEKYGPSCAAIAVIQDDKLIYSNAYGFSDKEKAKSATTRDIYRIASISKTITLLAILQLIEQGKLTMETRVFGAGSVLGNDYGIPPAASGKDQVTIKHLIEHTSGWQNNPNDPMFSYIGWSQQKIITELLQNRALITIPGEQYNYSNFGYLVLGRVIEKISGLSYEAYVKTEILTPCGINNMCIGGNTQNERIKDEVKYYHEESDRPYKLDIRRMDAHGGWLASAEDLAKLMCRIDRNEVVKDILSESVLNQTYLGYDTWIHTGSLPGTATVWMRMDDRLAFTLVANARSDDPSFWYDFVDSTASSIRRIITTDPVTVKLSDP